MANVPAFANGTFLAQKKARTGKDLDPDLASESGIQSGEDPDQVTDSEALGLRHRRRFGYTAEGAEENDQNIASLGRKPLKVTTRKSVVPVSRIANFHHGVNSHRTITTIKKH